jgi:hypothetical protein
MANIQIIGCKSALRSQRETQCGDVHVCITDTASKNPNRAWWITEHALLEYPVRDYYLPLLQENAENAARGESGDSLWRWRSFKPTIHSSVSAICRWNGAYWEKTTGQRLF